MYNKGTIIPGLIIFVLFVTFPLWFNALSTASTVPKPELPPGGEKECIASASEMRASHMVLLNEWYLNASSKVVISFSNKGKSFFGGLPFLHFCKKYDICN